MTNESGQRGTFDYAITHQPGRNMARRGASRRLGFADSPGPDQRARQRTQRRTTRQQQGVGRVFLFHATTMLGAAPTGPGQMSHYQPENRS